MHCRRKRAGLALLCFRPHEPVQALGRPNCVEIVEFGNLPSACWQRYPRLLGRRVNVDVGRIKIRVVHGTDANEPDGRTRLRVIAPDCDPAGWAASDFLAPAAGRGRQDDFRLTGGMDNTIGFIEGVERMRGPGLALAPPAMAGMNNQRRSDQTISDLSARASAFHVRLHQDAAFGSAACGDLGPDFSPGVAQADCAVEHQPGGLGVRIGAEIALALELHHFAGFQCGERPFEAGVA